MSSAKSIMDYENYIFDADGTLIDTSELIYLSYKETLNRVAGIEKPREEIIDIMGRPLKENLEILLGKKKKKEMEQIIKDHISYQLSIAHNHIKLFLGVKQILAKLQSKGRTLAIVSSRTRETLFAYLKHLDIYSYFSLFVTPETTNKHKPDPAPLLYAVSKLKAKREDCVYIGDSYFDNECAIAAKVDFCFVIWSKIKYTSLVKVPTHFICNMGELASLSD